MFQSAPEREGVKYFNLIGLPLLVALFGAAGSSGAGGVPGSSTARS